jgi:hypothetical protein
MRLVTAAAAIAACVLAGVIADASEKGPTGVHGPPGATDFEHIFA